jgi:hypothetical protein
MMTAMKHALVTFALAGCVTTAAFVRPNRVSIPILIGAAAADFIVTALIAAEAESFGTGGSIATGLGATGLDLAVGCIFGACTELKL